MQYDLVGQLLARHSSHYPEVIGNEANKPVRPQYHRMSYDYNEIGQLISAVNPNSRTNLAYDEGGRLITETLISHFTHAGQYQAREQTLQHDYDELGNRIATTLPDGKMINQLYYGSGHLYNQSLHDPSTDEYIELRHSERNKLHQEISRQQGSLTSSYNYDPMGRLIKQQSLPSGANSEHLTIQRDYHYDALGQLTHLSGHSVLDQNTKRTQQNTANQNQFTRNHQYQYDAQGRLTEHKLTDYQNHTGITEVFAFDPASNRVPVKVAQHKETDAKANNEDNYQKSHKQKSHKSDRPTTLKTHDKYITYTYDTHGRLLYKTQTPLGKDGQALKQSSSSIIGYRKSLQLEYNANNELSKSLSVTQEGLNLTEVVTTYHYDAFGRRIAKHSQTRDKTKRVNKNSVKFAEHHIQQRKTQYKHSHYLWDGDKQLQEQADTHVFTTIYEQNSFEPVARLVWLKDELTIAANDEPENDEGWYDNDNPAAKTRIQVYHYHNDQLGTPNELTNDRGEVVWLADYEAWGNTAKLIWREQLIDQMQVSKDELQPIRFQGQHFDQETGLHYNRFRYYDPDVGMFISRDPIQLKGGTNVFQYAPNPTGWVDPLGLVKIHGNWCGPDWTGGRKEPYNRALDRNNHYAAPLGRLDTACRVHDMCFAQCRVDNACNGTGRENCMIRCDNVLVAASQAIPENDPNSYSLTRRSVEGAISRHLGVENEIDTDCPNYEPEETNWEKFKNLF